MNSVQWHLCPIYIFGLGRHTITQKSNFLLPLGSLSELTPQGASQIPPQDMDVLCAPAAPSCKHRNWVCVQGGCSALITSGFTGHRAASLQPLHRQAFSRFWMWVGEGIARKTILRRLWARRSPESKGASLLCLILLLSQHLQAISLPASRPGGQELPKDRSEFCFHLYPQDLAGLNVCRLNEQINKPIKIF